MGEGVGAEEGGVEGQYRRNLGEEEGYTDCDLVSNMLHHV